jgi:hypothetical protein
MMRSHQHAVRRSPLNKLLNRNHHHIFSLESLCQKLVGTAIICLGCWGQSLPSIASPPRDLLLLDTTSFSILTNSKKTAHLVVQNPAQTETPSSVNNNSTIDLSPEIINGSPVLQKWLQGIPDVMSEMRTAPSFRTRVKVGYSQYPSTNQSGGFHVAVDDVFFGSQGLSASANYNSSSTGKRTAYGVDAQYYLLPLGGYLNITPLVGFRHLETDKYSRDGLNLGVKLMLVPSRGGGADIALSQSWVGFGSTTETGLTTLSVGYALTNNLRLSTDIQQQNAKENYDSRVGFGIEWMP